MLLSDFDFRLPPTQIAQRPLATRDASRMLVLERRSGPYVDRDFADFPTLLRGDELLVVNNAQVIPARLRGRRLESSAPTSNERSPAVGAEIEILLARQIDAVTWETLVRPGRKMHVGQRMQFGDGHLQAEVIAHGDHGQRTLRFSSNAGGDITSQLHATGHIPLPPYIDRADEPADSERYQTIFASRPGAIAAPTAGLHFTPEVIAKIRARGVEICELTLDVGLGTFQPIRSDTLEGHTMHAESYEIPPETAERVTRAKRQGRPVVAIGTTAVRALEDAAQRSAQAHSHDVLVAGPGEARLFITPGFAFRAVDALLTNFHLPRSTLLALVCAFAGREAVLAAYRHAVEAGYRFYSYGDCMLIR